MRCFTTWFLWSVDPSFGLWTICFPSAGTSWTTHATSSISQTSSFECTKVLNTVKTYSFECTKVLSTVKIYSFKCTKVFLHIKSILCGLHKGIIITHWKSLFIGMNKKINQCKNVFIQMQKGIKHCADLLIQMQEGIQHC